MQPIICRVAVSGLLGGQRKQQEVKPPEQQKTFSFGPPARLSLTNSSSKLVGGLKDKTSADAGPASLCVSRRRPPTALLLAVVLALFCVGLFISVSCRPSQESAVGEAESRFSSQSSSTHSPTGSTNSSRDLPTKSSNSRAMEEAEASRAAASYVLHHLLRRAGAPTARQRLSDWAPIRFRVAGLPVSLRARQVILRAEEGTQTLSKGGGSAAICLRVCAYLRLCPVHVKEALRFILSRPFVSASCVSLMSPFCLLVLRARRARETGAVSLCPSPLPSGWPPLTPTRLLAPRNCGTLPHLLGQ